MTTLVAGPPLDPPGEGSPPPKPRDRSRRGAAEACGGAPVLDLALCLILAVTVIGLLLAL